MNDFTALPDSIKFRVAWRTDTWVLPMEYLGTKDGLEIFSRLGHLNSTETEEIPTDEGPVNPTRQRCGYRYKFTGTAIAFHNEKVLVLSDNNTVHLLPPECLIHTP